jgi:hypothetical protein
MLFSIRLTEHRRRMGAKHQSQWVCECLWSGLGDCLCVKVVIRDPILGRSNSQAEKMQELLGADRTAKLIP